MTIEEMRLNLAVRVAVRAVGRGQEAPVEQRLEAFTVAYAALAGLDDRDGEWTLETAPAAWDLIRDLYPNGAPIERATADLLAAHGAIVAAARAPAPDLRKRPKRDA